MPYELEFTPTAIADMSRLDDGTKRRIRDKLHWMADNAEAVSHTALTGQYRSMFRLRIGDHRALYTYHRLERRIVVHFVNHRSEIYRSR